MIVQEIMHAPVVTCRPTDSLQHAAALMWDHDCGCIVVVDGSNHPTAIITDRDVCMAAYTCGRKLVDVPVSKAASRRLHMVRAADGLDHAEALMSDARVRRVPVVDDTGALVGILTLNDLFRSAGQLGRRHHALSAESLVRTCTAIGTAG